MDRLGRRARAAPQRKPDPLSESEEEPDAQLATELPTAAKEVDPVGQALVKLTQLVETLSAPKRRSPSTLDSLLDAAGSGASGSQEAAPSLRCNAQGLSILSATVEGLMKEDLHSLQTPGFDVPRSARAWLEHRSRIGSHETLARTSWAVAGALDAARRKGLGRVRGQAQRVDGGHGPGRHRPGVRGPDGDQAWSRILDGRWAEVALHHLRDQSDFLEKRAKLNRRAGQQPEEEDKETSRPDGKDKGKGGGRRRGEESK
eukprot:s3125_g8.t1